MSSACGLGANRNAVGTQEQRIQNPSLRGDYVLVLVATDALFRGDGLVGL